MNVEIFTPEVAQFGNREGVVLLEQWMSRTMESTKIAASFERVDSTWEFWPPTRIVTRSIEFFFGKGTNNLSNVNRMASRDVLTSECPAKGNEGPSAH